MTNPDIKERLDEIDPMRFYTVKQMWSELQCFPWKNHYRAYMRLVKKEAEGDNKMNVKIVKGVRKNKYLVQGRDIIRYRDAHFANN